MTGSAALAATPDPLPGQAPRSVREIQIIPNGSWCYGLSLVNPPCRRRRSALSERQDGNACGATGAAAPEQEVRHRAVPPANNLGKQMNHAKGI
jgi:hypothetical protein